MNQQPTPQQQIIVWWVLWAAFQSGILVIYFFLGQAQSFTPTDEPTLWQLAFLPVLISGAIRWSLLPQLNDATKALPCFIVGIALAEMSCFLGIFIFPSHKLPLFVASAAGIFQFIPIYAGRYYRERGSE
jgi:hypothetical protein